MESRERKKGGSERRRGKRRKNVKEREGVCTSMRAVEIISICPYRPHLGQRCFPQSYPASQFDLLQCHQFMYFTDPSHHQQLTLRHSQMAHTGLREANEARRK